MEYGSYQKMPDVVKEEYRNLKQEYDLTKDQLNSIYNQVSKKYEVTSTHSHLLPNSQISIKNEN